MQIYKKISAEMIIIFFAMIFLIRNILIPLASDDYSYAFVWNADGIGNIGLGTSSELERIESISDIIKSQWNHYMTWGGRTVAHTLIQIVVWLGKPVFDIITVLMFILLVYLINWTAQGNLTKMTKVNAVWIMLAISLCVPEWIITMLWLTGAVNYMWMAVFQMLFILPYVQAYRSSMKVPTAIIVLSGICAGWSNEAGGFATLFIVGSLLMIMKRQGRMQKWQVVGFTAFVIGYALLMFAPGNLARMNVLNYSQYHITLELIIGHLKGSFLEIINNEFILILMVVYYLASRNYRQYSREEIIMMIMGAGGLLVPVIMLFSPEFPGRACYSSAIFMTTASVIALNKIREIKLYPKWLTLKNKFISTGAMICVIIWLIGIAGCIYADSSVHRQINKRFEYINEHKDDEMIVVKKINPSRRLEKFLGLRIYHEKAIIFGGDLRTDSHWGQNVCFAKYYGIKAISAIR